MDAGQEIKGRWCKTCNLFYPLEKLAPKADCKYGRMPLCLTCKNTKQRNYRTDNDDKFTKEYEKTVNGYLMRTYRNMKSRVSGIQKQKAHIYKGLDLLDKESFYTWSLDNEDFQKLLDEYQNSGYNMKYAPSVDRIDTTKGYTIGNIRWITHSLNSKLGALKEKYDATK